jgi:hypothetical protein
MPRKIADRGGLGMEAHEAGRKIVDRNMGKDITGQINLAGDEM